MRSVVYLSVCCVVMLCVQEEADAFIFRSRSSSSRRGNRGSSSYPHDITSQRALTRLYNTPVTRAEHWERPLDGWPTMIGPLRHSGVVVTTSDGRRLLVHKGSDYGRSSDTVVVDAGHMSGRWRRVDGQDVQNSRVADYVRAGGANYDLLTDNCHSGRCRMMDLP